MKKLFFFGLVFLTAPVVSNAQISADEIIRQSEDRVRGNTSEATITINIVRPGWSRELTMHAWSKGKQLSMILVQSPAKEKGTVFLKRGKEVWNWIPSIERSIKLPPSMMSQSWMGTDFTNDDLVKESSVSEDYTHKMLGEQTIMGLPCYQIEMIPKPDAAVVWGKVIVWVDKMDLMQLKIEFYDEEGLLMNVINAIKTGMVSGRMLPTSMEMIPVGKKGQKTVMTYQDLIFDKAIDDSFFTTNNMKLIR